MLPSFADAVFKRTYAITPDETWLQAAARVAKAVADDPAQETMFTALIRERVFIPGGRYLYSAGRPLMQVSNCFGFLAEDSREGWADLMRSALMCLSTGGGIGVNYSKVRPKGTPIARMGGSSSGPLALMQMVNEVGRHVMSGGSRRSALWAGLHWKHPDIDAFIALKDWNADVRAMKAKSFDYPAPLDMTNVSVIVDQEYLDGLSSGNVRIAELHQRICAAASRTGEPAFRNDVLITADDPGAVTGNPCQESVLHDNDVCNLGSIVLPRILNTSHLEFAVRAAVQFLYNGSLRSYYPTEKIAATATRNRRIGLGIMGLHEFMLTRGGKYEWSSELGKFLGVWKNVAEDESRKYAARKGGAVPVTTRAIAPTGTISIMAGTTSGIEPIYCVAYKRRYQQNGNHLFQYVVDPTAKRLLDRGFAAKDIEDAFSLSHDVPRRLTVQANVQRYTDQAISSTVNLPADFASSSFASTVADFLPRLKGVAFYPDGGRPNQPIVPVAIEEALGQEGVVYEENLERCLNGVCGL